MTDDSEIRLSNEYVRVFADRLASVLLDATAVVAALEAAALDPAADPDATLDDGSDVDGRRPITRGQMRAVAGAAASLLSWAQETGAGAAADLVQVNARARLAAPGAEG